MEETILKLGNLGHLLAWYFFFTHGIVYINVIWDTYKMKNKRMIITSSDFLLYCYQNV